MAILTIRTGLALLAGQTTSSGDLPVVSHHNDIAKKATNFK